MSIPGYSPSSYVVRPNKLAIPEHEFLLLKSPDWIWPEYLSVAEGDWGNWQTPNNQRWCHIEINGPSFPNSIQSNLYRMMGNSKRTELRNAQALFITATHEDCAHLLANCPIEPDIKCANGPGGDLIGWVFHDKAKREEQRATIHDLVSKETKVEILDIEDAIHITSNSENPLVPSPGRELYYPAQLFWEYEDLPSPHYLKGRSCAFIEFWKLPVELAIVECDGNIGPFLT